jgi:hypothetical protein
VTGGDAYGTSGAERRAFWQAAGFVTALIVAINVVNVLTVVHDRARGGHPIAAWEPMVWESSSGVLVLACLLVFYPPVLSLLRRARGWPAIIAINACACVIFSVVHVAGMVALRHLAYGAVGETYPLSLADFPYEFRKDVLTYALIAVVLWQWRRAAVAVADRAALTAAAVVRPPASGLPSAPATFDIREGARTLRVATGEIVAVTSAGNYVEVILADGRRPLMRATLSTVEAALAPHGFLRTHRSWLVNAARVQAIEPEGSGDYAIELAGAVRAPLSRRFPEALQRLRG